MKYSFNCYGHKSITAKHKTTLEFTKDSEMGLGGDCIIGVKVDFSLPQLKKFIKSVSNNKKITIIIETINNKNNINNNKIIEIINAEINPNFNSNEEMVIRKTDFISERTFAIRANKAAFELGRDLVEFLKGKENKIKVIIENKP